MRVTPPRPTLRTPVVVELTTLCVLCNGPARTERIVAMAPNVVVGLRVCSLCDWLSRRLADVVDRAALALGPVVARQGRNDAPLDESNYRPSRAAKGAWVRVRTERVTCTSGKVHYPDRRTARLALLQWRRRNPARLMHAAYYSCARCGGWHLTSGRTSPVRVR